MSKEAMKLALEALEQIARLTGPRWALENSYAGHLEAITALREALAEQALNKMAENARELGLDYEPAQQEPWCMKMNGCKTKCEDCPVEVQPAQQEPVALPEKIYEFVPTPDPVKWHHPECEGECIACRIERVVREACGSQGLGYLQQHLTSPPAQQEPLTVVEIMREWNSANNSVVNFARVIEAAHGIKENT